MGTPSFSFEQSLGHPLGSSLHHLSEPKSPYFMDLSPSAHKALLLLLLLSLQSCPTLCDPIDGSPPGSPVPGILQARTVEWVAISFSNA